MTAISPQINRFAAVTARICLLLAAALAVTGCGRLVSKATSGVSSGLTAGIENHDDPDTVRAALPAYLLMLDGLIESSPDNPNLLLAGSRLYGVYAGIFVDTPERATRLARRALNYAGRVFCPDHPTICESKGRPFEEFEAAASALAKRELEPLFAYAAAWAGLIQADSGNWSMIADIPKVQALLERVVTLDPSYQNGQPLLYLGVLSTLLPPAYGGKPEEGQAYFERALALSGGRNQMARVLYAQHYTRLVFDRELHDRLLDEALAADPAAPHLTLINVLAQQRAAELKASADDYF